MHYTKSEEKTILDIVKKFLLEGLLDQFMHRKSIADKYILSLGWTWIRSTYSFLSIITSATPTPIKLK